MEGKCALPEKDIIAPNQRSWSKMAKCMGARNTWRHQCLPDEQGLIECSIGAIKGKCKRLHEDPYAGSKCSGKHAKLDAQSQAANAHMCIDVPPLDAPFLKVLKHAFPWHTPHMTLCVLLHLWKWVTFNVFSTIKQYIIENRLFFLINNLK